MTERANDVPAFPQQCADALDVGMVNEGMSLRDYFAAHAIGAIISVTSAGHHTPKGEGNIRELMAKDAYEIADAMLAEREKGGAA